MPKDNYELILIDHDRVEEHNLQRQNFFAADLDKYKSQALAERLARLYGCEIGYSVYPYSGGGSHTFDLIIGCVDNAAARKAIANDIGKYDWWIDSGNGQQSGQVLIGNISEPTALKQSFKPSAQTVDMIPSPALQQPSLLVPVPEKPRDCAEAVRDNEQSPVINQAMAALVLQFVYKLINNELTWIGAYLDLDAGTLSTTPAEPQTVARMLGIKESTLVYQKREAKNRELVTV